MAARVRRIGLSDLGNLPGVLTPLGRIPEPVLEGKSSLSEVFLAKDIFVPGDELDGGELVDY